MGCGGPKKKDFEAGPEAKINASVAVAEKAFSKENSDPLNQERARRSKSDQPIKELRGVANADSMQALTSTPNVQAILRGEDVGSTASALTGQLGVATRAAVGAQNDEGIAALDVARGNAARSMSGMADAGNMETSNLLAAAKAKQTVSNAKFAALGQITGAAGSRLYENRQNKKADQRQLASDDRREGRFLRQLGDGQQFPDRMTS